MSEADAQERREHPRSLTQLQVEFPSLNAFVAAYTRDLSLGGCFIEGSDCPPVGQSLDISIFIPQLDEPMLVKAEVAWIQSPNSPVPWVTPPGMGVRFLFDNKNDKDEFEAVMLELIRDDDSTETS